MNRNSKIVLRIVAVLVIVMLVLAFVSPAMADTKPIQITDPQVQVTHDPVPHAHHNDGDKPVKTGSGRTPGCVSYGEWEFSEYSAQHAWEKFAGVNGMGRVVSSQHHGAFVVRQYEACNHSTEPGSDNFGAVQTAYRLNKNGQYMTYSWTWMDGMADVPDTRVAS